MKKLSKRQAEAFHYVFLGKHNTDIGQIMGISPLTVKNMIQTILRKLNAENRQQACYLGLKVGLLKSPYEAPEMPKQEVKVIAIPEMQPVCIIGSVKVYQDDEGEVIVVDGEKRQLHPTQFRLLRYLAEHANKVCPRQNILDGVWGRDRFVEERTIDVQALRLRRKLQGSGIKIATIRGEGYMLLQEQRH